MDIITDPYFEADIDELTSVIVSGQHSPQAFDGGSVAIAVIKSAEPTENEGDEDDTEAATVLELNLETDEAVQLALNILDVANEVKRNQTTLYSHILAFKSATTDCMRGRVGTMIMSLSNIESPRSDDGSILLNVQYLDDVEGDGNLIHELTNFETFIPPFDQEQQLEWLRGMVGGNHEFTSSIAVKFDGWSFQDIDNGWAEKLNVVVEDGVITPAGE